MNDMAEYESIPKRFKAIIFDGTQDSVDAIAKLLASELPDENLTLEFDDILGLCVYHSGGFPSATVGSYWFVDPKTKRIHGMNEKRFFSQFKLLEQ